MTRSSVALALLLLCLARPALTLGQQPGATPSDTTSSNRDSLLESGVVAGEADAEKPRRQLVKWNEYAGPYFSIRVGGGFLVDYNTYAQDADSKAQFTLTPGFKVRDSRLILGGRLGPTPRVTWQAGLMYDGVTYKWFVRQTGIMIAVPELWGHLWVGRAKEGPSLNRVMVGYDGWTHERFTFSDAAIPLLADGVKWLGYLPDRHLLWNVGFFGDQFSKGQTFSYYEHQFAGRVAWVPMVSDSAGTLLHIGVSLQTGKPTDGQLQLKSKPEASAAPNFIDTGKFPASSATLTGFEVYYRPGPWLFGTEYFFEKAKSPETHDPLFHGGDVAAIWLITGETRSYNTVGGYFRTISPRRTVFEGGPGAWEAVLRLSYSDLDAGTLRGGKFWRLTPMVNWYLSDYARLELIYGYGVLDRFDRKGATQFFQSRLQLRL